ncbi:MAG: hypothetical protein ABIA75_12925 [Candidatus Neomarinimicrobiota bacterium]
MKTGLLIIGLLIFCTPASAFSGSLGLQLGFTGGPYLALCGSADLTKAVAVDVAAGGLPGIIGRIESNLRINTGWKYPHYFRVGIGNFRFYRGQGDGHSLTEFHLSGGITRLRGRLNLSTELGLVYVPPLKTNDWCKSLDDYDASMIPIVPMVAFKCSYPLP